MAYAYRASITVDNTKVAGSSDLTNFPVLISGTYDGTGGEPDIRTVANGGNVENASTGGNSGSVDIPADLAFFSDSAATTPLDFEIENYNATTGAINAWVRIPTLDYDNDTVIYMHYGDSAVSTSQEDVNGTWNSNYKAVWHFNNNNQDSTSNNRDVTGGTASTDSKIGTHGLAMNGNEEATFTAILLTSIHFWVKPSTSVNKTVFRSATPDNTIQTVGSSIWAMWDGNSYDSTITGTLTNSAYHKYDFCYDGANYDYYYDGAYVEEHQTIDQITVDRIGRTSSLGMPGVYDEVRISSITSADWLTTEYNTQNSPSTFYTMGSETANGASTAVKDMLQVGIIPPAR